jgi:hypothetical protein
MWKRPNAIVGAGTVAALVLLVTQGAAFEGFTPVAPGDGVSADSTLQSSSSWDGASASLADSANGRKAAVPSVAAQRLNGGGDIKLDGRLDDDAWKYAQAAEGFRQWDPDRGAFSSQETIFKVAYDDGAVYFGIACLETDPSKIVAKLSRRDRQANSDLVSIYVDPYMDHTTGYNFKVTAMGVQSDGYIFNDGDRDDDWDAVWQAETYRDEKGWYAEVRVPFSAIRYKTGSVMTWGLNVYRYMHGRGEDTAWVTWDRTTRGFVSRFGRLTGLTGVRPPRQIELLPYVVQRSTDYSIDGTPDDVDGFQNFGADLRYGITGDLALNATVQPDFGQVEADPAVLNLSPFETFYAEKRPFFIEGSRFFQHPDFNMFYSRRIGTGDENSRIRYAAKLTGKTLGGVSIAALAASTDVTADGQAHNLFKSGNQLSRYFVARLGKEFDGGRQRFNVMQTAVLNTASRDQYGDYASRDAYTTGVDFDLNSKNREYNVQGSFVGSILDPETLASNPSVTGDPIYGTGGALDVRRRGGRIQGGLSGRWESPRLNINDIGFLESPDEIFTSAYIHYPLSPGGKSKLINRGELNLNANRSWMYDARAGLDVNTGDPAWSYGAGHPQYSHIEVSTWMQFRNFREGWMGIGYNGEGTHRYETRGGPLIREPHTYGGWAGGSTDSRKDLVGILEGSLFYDTAKNISLDLTGTTRWNQSSAVNHELRLGYHSRIDDTQWLDSPTGGAHPVGVGIGGVSYVFGDIDQKTADITLRSNILFSRNQSLEIYAQPFLTVGNYSRVRELIRADSYDLYPYSFYEARDFDFSYAAVNLNVVYRWEYRPGSTLYLVWTQSREKYDERQYTAPGGDFNNEIGGNHLFGNEPENRVLAKVTYWIAI